MKNYKVTLNLDWDIEAEDKQDAIAQISEDYFRYVCWVDDIKVKEIKKLKEVVK